MRTSIPRARQEDRRAQVRSTSLKALAVAAHLEREDGPPGQMPGRARRTPDPA